MPRAKRVCTELLPPRRTMPMQSAEAMLNELVQRKVAEAMASDSAILQPFMQTKRVTDELRRSQDVIHLQKFSLYIADWGCHVCGRKDAGHLGLAMCPRCYGQVTKRMAITLRKAAAARPKHEMQAIDLESLAREAMMPAVAALNPRSRRKR
jgi:hypothetical protein